ncbi:MAG: DUF4012 domain-containing protein [Anaerolineae bacterium]|nr:DUF4012 domain-containing protein [Anaerolineae bacterium]
MKQKRFSLFLIILGTLLLLVWATEVARAALSLRTHLREVNTLMENAGKNLPDPAILCSLVHDLRSDVKVLTKQAGWIAWLAPALSWLPGIGKDMRDTPYLLATADHLTSAGAMACEALGPAFGLLEGNISISSIELILPHLAAARPSLEGALWEIEQAIGAWGQVDLTNLSPPLARRLALLNRALPLLKAGLNAALIAPDLLGFDGPRTYLILAQNEDELRPTGGFITGVGQVSVQNGRLVSMVFRDSYAVDDFSLPYPDPPEPLRRYMGIDLWVFRDSNWSPDFPTAARQAIALYRPGVPVQVNGIIALDQFALRELVGAIGPLTVEGETVTRETVIPYIRQAWAPEEGKLTGEWWLQRKSFMDALARAAWERLQSGSVNGRTLARTLLRLLEEKHLIIYFSDPRAQALLAEQNWDGALRPGVGDFLMVVDANVGYNKANAKVQESIRYEVDFGHQPPRATLTLIYTHTAPTGTPCVPESRYDPVYELMMDRCLWSYLRIYIPQGSKLIDATRIPVPGEAIWSGEPESGEITVKPAEEALLLSLAVLVLLPPGTSQTRSFTWELPEKVITWRGDEGAYTLRIQKQPGTVGHSLQVRIHLGDSFTLLAADPSPSAIEDSTLVFETRLDRDREFKLRFLKTKKTAAIAEPPGFALADFIVQ